MVGGTHRAITKQIVDLSRIKHLAFLRNITGAEKVMKRIAAYLPNLLLLPTGR
jgi:hypothetical protein